MVWTGKAAPPRQRSVIHAAYPLQIAPKPADNRNATRRCPASGLDLHVALCAGASRGANQRGSSISSSTGIPSASAWKLSTSR
jgi:hypothetical protein